jgi:hypothetical protein
MNAITPDLSTVITALSTIEPTTGLSNNPQEASSPSSSGRPS